MIHPVPLDFPDEFPVHEEFAGPVTDDDRYADVKLDAHDRTPDHDPVVPDADLYFKCRIRRWAFNEGLDKVNIFVIPGIAHSCNFFNPLVKCMSIDDEFRARVSSVYAFDLPGHGASGSPRNIKFGMLRLADYISAIRQIMDVVKAEAGKIDYVVAHSMGGMLAMLVEKALAEESLTLKTAYGTDGVVLLASAMPEQVHWELGSGAVLRHGVPVSMLSMLLPYVTVSPRYLAHGRLSNEDFLKTFFAVYTEHPRLIDVVPGAPAGDTVSIINSAESYSALAELGGLDIDLGGMIKRPFIEEGLFTEYKFGVSGYTKDILFTPAEEARLCRYLSKSETRKIFRRIDHDYAVHDDPYTWPCPSFQLVKDVMNLPDSE